MPPGSGPSAATRQGSAASPTLLLTTSGELPSHHAAAPPRAEGEEEEAEEDEEAMTRRTRRWGKIRGAQALTRPRRATNPPSYWPPQRDATTPSLYPSTGGSAEDAQFFV